MGATSTRQVLCRKGTHQGSMRLGQIICFGWFHSNGVSLVRACYYCFSGVLNHLSVVMLCNFLDAMEVVSLLRNIPQNQTSMPRHIPGTPYTRPLPGPPRLPSGWRGSPPEILRSAFEGFLAGSWHNHAPGETRVRPDYAGLVTFYDTSLSSLIDARYGKDRLHLRLEGISTVDSERVRAELRTVLTREKDQGNGINWGSIS
jgi:hypothetical protein